MNPRVSRSSALASKATGFPIAKIAAKLAVGYRLDEVRNDITRRDAGVVRADHRLRRHQDPALGVREAARARSPVLGTQMQSVGEVMAIGRTFAESLQKALRSLETGRLRAQLRSRPSTSSTHYDDDELVRAAAVPTPERIFQIEAALRRFVSIERVHEATGVDPWFCDQILQIVEERERLAEVGLRRDDARRLAAREAARLLRRAARRTSGASSVAAVRAARLAAGVRVTYKTVDTCAAEFDAHTPYHYGTYEDEDEVAPRHPARGRDPRQRPEPHRPGRRVRLLLRARRVRAVTTPASRPSWSTATPRPSRPTTTRATGSSSSRSPRKTC